MILEEIVQEVVADDFSTGAALIAKGFCDIIKVCFQCIRTVHYLQPFAQARYDVIVQIFFIGDRNNIVCIREEHFINHNTFIAVCTFQFISRNRPGTVVQLIRKCLQGIWFTCKNQSILINRVAAKHTAHGVAEQALDIPLQVSLAHGHIFIFHFRSQLILQAVNVDKNAVQLFFIGFQLVKTVIAFFLPLVKGFGNRGNIAKQWVLLTVPRSLKRVPIILSNKYVFLDCFSNYFFFRSIYNVR